MTDICALQKSFSDFKQSSRVDRNIPDKTVFDRDMQMLDSFVAVHKRQAPLSDKQVVQLQRIAGVEDRFDEYLSLLRFLQMNKNSIQESDLKLMHDVVLSYIRFGKMSD